MGRGVQPVYGAMACDKWGSRAFDSLWTAATLEQRQSIAASLVSSIALRSNRYGSFLYERCGLGCYADRPDDWRRMQIAAGAGKRQLPQHHCTPAHVPRQFV